MRDMDSPFAVSLAATIALCCTTVDLALRGEITVLQCYGVPMRAVARPLLCMVLSLQLAFVPLLVVDRVGIALVMASLVSSLIAAAVILRIAWSRRERGIVAACVTGIGLQTAAIAALVGLMAVFKEFH